MTTKSISRVTALSIIVMAIAAAFAMSQVFAEAFILSIDELPVFLTNSSFKASVIAWLIILLCDLMVSWGLYSYYKKRNHLRAAISGLFRLLYSIILAYGISKLFLVSLELSNDEFSAEIIHQNIHSFQAIWQFGLIVFGLHLITLSKLVCQKKKLLKLIAILLFLAGVGYFLSNTLDLFIDNYESYRPTVEAVFIFPMIFSEIGLAFWLLLKGGREASIG
ncbi:MAG: hypothetical protein CMC96_00545 [Flavobacteriales bacterium]|nr:hypothetical protein [Flavobacteriales bacterium]|tara:strand:- start:36079 stop:36741 length:663 start_codon:yes stop_codon:yes gene_type:complete